MPFLTPANNGPKPTHWRDAYDALVDFRRDVAKYRINTSDWHIILPGRLKGFADPRWQLQWTNVDGTLETMFIGSDGMTARNTIRKLHATYMEILRARRGDKASSDPRKLQQNDPRENAKLVQSMKERWDRMRHVRSQEEWERNLAANPDVAKFMASRAGYLVMTMEEYLYKHPMSPRWPIPPHSQAELMGRLNQDKDYENYKDRNRPDETPMGSGPGWGGG